METLVLPAVIADAAPDALALLLADKRSPQTRRAYAADLRHFFGSPDPDAVRAFLALPAPAVALRLHEYKARLIQAGLSEATVNRRLSALRSLLKHACRIGLAQTDGAGLVDNEKSQSYRDTRGISLPLLKRLVKLPGADTLRGLRDTALLRLLAQNALRRAEVCALSIRDFDPEGKRLMILGKGRGAEKAPVTLSAGAVSAILDYLHATGHAADRDAPLFANLDRRPGHAGRRLTVDGLFHIVQTYGRALGIEGLTPHKLRHSAITGALDLTAGDVRAAQKLSRHRDLRTVALYDDNRRDEQGRLTDLLAGALE